MDVSRRQPIGIELVKRGIVNQEDIKVALDYQKNHPEEKLGDIIHKLNCVTKGNCFTQLGIYLAKKQCLSSLMI